MQDRIQHLKWNIYAFLNSLYRLKSWDEHIPIIIGSGEHSWPSADVCSNYSQMLPDHGGRITGGALTLHQLHSVGACVSYAGRILSDITEQLLVGH